MSCTDENFHQSLVFHVSRKIMIILYIIEKKNKAIPISPDFAQFLL